MKTQSNLPTERALATNHPTADAPENPPVESKLSQPGNTGPHQGEKADPRETDNTGSHQGEA